MKGGFTSDAFGQKYMQEYIRESLKKAVELDVEVYECFKTGTEIAFDLGEKVVVFNLEAMGPDLAIRWASVEDYFLRGSKQFIKSGLTERKC
jgi:hypothetical protein